MPWKYKSDIIKFISTTQLATLISIGHILGDAQSVPGVQRPVHEDDIGHGDVTAAVLRHREVHTPLQEAGGELGPEHVRAHLHEEGEGEGVSEGVT